MKSWQAILIAGAMIAAAIIIRFDPITPAFADGINQGTAECIIDVLKDSGVGFGEAGALRILVVACQTLNP